MTQVLIIDDDAAIRETLRFVFEDAGYEVVEAPDGAVALQLLHATSVGLVALLDNVMPGLDGVEVIERLEAEGVGFLPPPHAYMLITASPQRISPALAQRLQRLGVPVLSKPFDLDTLLAVVARLAGGLRAAS